jgi:hypothetical protein
MARARNIKPALFKNEILGVADPLYTLLFEGLWILADREGRVEDRPLRIKGEIFPYREGIDVNAMLDWLQAEGFIHRYQARGVKCIVIVNFAKHQNPHKNESASELPAPEEAQGSSVSASESIGEASEKIGSAPADSLNLIPDSGFPQPETTAPAEPPPRRARTRAADWAEDFEAIWQTYPRKPGMSRANTEKAFAARLNEGARIPEMLAGVQAYAAYVLAMGTEPQFIKSPETFFGPGRHWLSDWTPPARASPQSGQPTQLTKAGQATARNMEAWLERKRQEQEHA